MHRICGNGKKRYLGSSVITFRDHNGTQSILLRIIAPRGHTFSSNERRLPLHPYADRVSISSHEWSMRRSESTVSSIVTVVDIVVVTRWFKFLTRDSCCQAQRKRHSRFLATLSLSLSSLPPLFLCYSPPSSLRFFPNNDCFERSLLAWMSYAQLAQHMGGSSKRVHFL